KDLTMRSASGEGARRQGRSARHWFVAIALGVLVAATSTPASAVICPNGTYVSGETCVPCAEIVGCATQEACTGPSNSQCRACANGTWLQDGLTDTCHPCTEIAHCFAQETCTVAADSQCTACDSGYFLSQSAPGGADTCQACAPVAFCVSTPTCSGPSD